MGQAASHAESAGDDSPPVTPPRSEVGKMRQEYLQRLGIQRDGKASSPNKPGWLSESFEEAVAEPPDTPEKSSAALLEELPRGALDLGSQDDFRLSFLRKLSYQKVWIPQAQRPPQHQTAIIFDWDDTLLCTTFLNLQQGQTMQPMVERQIKGIEKAAGQLLEEALRLGSTFIITNATAGWVEYSAARWVPGLLPVLERVRVISARGNYEAQYPNEVGQWKVQAFLEVQRQMDSKLITNIMCLGDSQFEMDAVHLMGKGFDQALVKTVKFRADPTPEELLGQLRSVSKRFERITLNARSLTITWARKLGEPA